MWSLVSTTFIRDRMSISMHLHDNLQQLLVICGRQFPLHVSDTKCQSPCTYKTTCSGSQLYVVISFHYVYQRLNVKHYAPTRQPEWLLVICGRQFLLRVSETKCQAPCTYKTTCSGSSLYVVVIFHYVYHRLNVKLHAPTRQPAAAPSYMWSLVSTTCIRD